MLEVGGKPTGGYITRLCILRGRSYKAVAITMGLNTARNHNIKVFLLTLQSTMDPEFKKTVIADFPVERDSFVDELEALVAGDTRGRGAAAMKTELRRISNTLSM